MIQVRQQPQNNKVNFKNASVILARVQKSLKHFVSIQYYLYSASNSTCRALIVTFVFFELPRQFPLNLGDQTLKKVSAN